MCLPKDVQVFGFSGKMGSGKDFVAQHVFQPLIGQERFVILSFADAMKIQCIVEEHVPRELIYGRKTSQSRQTLQAWGKTKRATCGQDVFIRYLHETILNHLSRGVKLILVTDVRFVEEVKYIEERLQGKVVRVVAPQRTLAKLLQEAPDDVSVQQTIANDVSETNLDSFPWSREQIILNDPEDDVLSCVKTFISSIQSQAK